MSTKEERKLDTSCDSRYNSPREKWVCKKCGNSYLEEREKCDCGEQLEKKLNEKGSNII